MILLVTLSMPINIALGAWLASSLGYGPPGIQGYREALETLTQKLPVEEADEEPAKE